MTPAPVVRFRPYRRPSRTHALARAVGGSSRDAAEWLKTLERAGFTLVYHPVATEPPPDVSPKVDGHIQVKQLIRDAQFYDHEAGIHDHPPCDACSTASEFVSWLTPDVKGTPEHEESLKQRYPHTINGGQRMPAAVERWAREATRKDRIRRGVDPDG